MCVRIREAYMVKVILRSKCPSLLTQGEGTPRTRLFVSCRQCGNESVFHKRHREALGRRIGKIPDIIKANDLCRHLDQFRCKACGSSGASVREEPRKEAAVVYVASGTVDRDEPGFLQGKLVFHDDTCEWVGHIHKATIITFRCREEAIEMGFSPCRHCKP